MHNNAFNCSWVQYQDIDDFHVTRRSQIFWKFVTLVGKDLWRSGKEVEMLLITGKDLTDDDEATLTTNLRKMTLKQLKFLAKNLSIKLTGSTKKADVIDRLLAMARIGAIYGHSNLCNDGTANICISDEAKKVLKTLPLFFERHKLE